MLQSAGVIAGSLKTKLKYSDYFYWTQLQTAEQIKDFFDRYHFTPEVQKRAAVLLQELLDALIHEDSPASKYDLYGLSAILLLATKIEVYAIDVDKAQLVGFDEAKKDNVGTRAGLKNLIAYFQNQDMSGWGLVKQKRNVVQGMKLVEERYNTKLLECKLKSNGKLQITEYLKCYIAKFDISPIF